MSRLRVWTANVPTVEGTWGTGPVDLSVATQVLQGAPGFDLPGGSGSLFDGAYRWFVNAANEADSAGERSDHLLEAVRALNNLAVWCMTRWDHPDRGQAAMNALQEAERLLDASSKDAGELRGGVYFNLGNLLAATGHRAESKHYLKLARTRGVS